jgi:3-oxoadipate enol-lactonase
MPDIHVGDTRIHFRRAGNGRPAVFVHAFLMDSRYWLDQLAGLGEARDCIAPDLAGFGYSDAIVTERIDPEHYARQLLAFLDAMEISHRADLVGFSGGAIVCALAAALAPERVASVTLMSSSFTSGPDEPYRRYQQEMARLVVVEGKDALFRRFDEYIFGKSPSLMARARYKTMLEHTSYEMFVALLTGETLAPRPDLPGQIGCPVLLPYGEHDVVVPRAKADELVRLFPNATACCVPEAGRLLTLENPGAVNAILRKFWSDLDA